MYFHMYLIFIIIIAFFFLVGLAQQYIVQVVVLSFGLQVVQTR